MCRSQRRNRLIYRAPTLTVRWALPNCAGHGEIGGVVRGRHTITLFRRPRTVHLEAGGQLQPSVRPSVRLSHSVGRWAGLMARLSTVDGRPMEVRDHDCGFRSLATRKIDRQRRAINATRHTPVQALDRTPRTPSLQPPIAHIAHTSPHAPHPSPFTSSKSRPLYATVVRNYLCRRRTSTSVCLNKLKLQSNT